MWSPISAPVTVAVELVEQAGIGRRQQLPGDGAEERRRHERGRHQRAHGLARTAGRCAPPASPSARRRGSRRSMALVARISVVNIGARNSGSVISVAKLSSVKCAGLVDHAVVDQPRHRQHDQHAQQRGERDQHRPGQIDPERAALPACDAAWLSPAMAMRRRLANACRAHFTSHAEDLLIARLDLDRLRFDRDRIVLHHLDVLEQPAGPASA